ncbi:outer membrane lipoprotein-sorting protein [Dokdonia sp. Hel_I_53]|uniref:outer membrane lipoprotein-sorting protein n=1 Tax=Dokdonia sp. Hel_I_53 TaxID=1566287 RepID=UPI0011A17B6F|nr:outer membrane lipoprotein-sorting protein [Dokdonia sp. Hel_I_53]
MKTIKFMVVAMIFSFVATTQAQTAEEIIANYFENTGGLDAWNSLEALKFEGAVKVQGMELPMTMVQTKEGKQMTMAEFQGMKFYQGVFDGETMWNTNQMTMAAEKSDAETTANAKLEMNDFADPFLNYLDKGYTVELVGKETVEGTETYKIRLTKEPIMVDGKETPSVGTYYFDTENFVPIVVEQEVSSGPMKGMVSQTKLSDYQEVEGIYFPMSITAGAKGQPGGQEIMIKSIEINPEVTDDMFAFPEKQ